VVRFVVVLTIFTSATAVPVDAGVRVGDEASVIRVPQDKKTIQAAVNAAKPGTLVLVSPGVYEEAVTVRARQRNIVIRGVDRETTILDGEFRDDPGRESGFTVLAHGVAIENITVRNFLTNGFLWQGVDGYRGSYLTAIRNGDYGIYAFDSVNGQFDHSFAQGSPDAGFYIGQCSPCHALIVDVEAEWNGLGYSGTNASIDLVIARSAFHDNRAGIVPNSGSYEELAPEHRNTIVGNHVYNNGNGRTAAIEIAQIATGNGILLAGGNENVVERNLVTGHDAIGIGAVPLPERALRGDVPGAVDFDARDNVVRDNELSNNGYDLVSVTSIADASDGGGNCFAGNEYTTSAPPAIEVVLPCDSDAQGFVADIALLSSIFLTEKPPSVDYKEVDLPAPPALPNFPRARTAKARPATREPSITIDLDALRVPTGA
jgi:Right handed beta helix region